MTEFFGNRLLRRVPFGLDAGHCSQREAWRMAQQLRIPDRSLKELLGVMTWRHADGSEVALKEIPLVQTLASGDTLCAEELVLSFPRTQRHRAYQRDTAFETPNQSHTPVRAAHRIKLRSSEIRSTTAVARVIRSGQQTPEGDPSEQGRSRRSRSHQDFAIQDRRRREHPVFDHRRCSRPRRHLQDRRFRDPLYNVPPRASRPRLPRRRALRHRGLDHAVLQRRIDTPLRPSLMANLCPRAPDPLSSADTPVAPCNVCRGRISDNHYHPR